jgi:alkylation response protein AidB-like acyl-CoA dehydrogenase
MDLEMLTLFEDGLRRFSRERYAPAQMIEGTKNGKGGRYWHEMAELGWFELAVSDNGLPEIVPLLSVYRVAGEGLWREPIDCVFGEPAVVAACATEPALRRQLCDGLASGAAPLACAARERGDGWSAGTTTTRAHAGADGVVLSGHKVAVAGDPACVAYLVTAADEQTGRVAFYRVDRGARGLDVRRYPTVEGRQLADLHLDRTPGVFICAVGPEVPTRAWGELLAAAECVGIMHGALQDTVAYLLQRQQFGRPLIDFQVLQHRLADMQMLVRETDALLRELAEDLDAGRSLDPRSLLALRAQTSRSAREVTREAVQMHGGMGVTQECRVSHYYRRVLTLESLHGSEAWALERLCQA